MIEDYDCPLVFGVGGFARSGKDTFVKIARKILENNGYTTVKLAFADALKVEIDPFLKQHYNISAWTDNTEEKKIIRPLLVAHGCQKRMQTEGKYWVDKVDELIKSDHFDKDVIFVSDCRFPNEVDWVKKVWNGWFVHVSKYSIIKDVKVEFDYELHPELDGVEHPEQYFPEDFIETPIEKKVFDKAPNEEESYNDPICKNKSDYKIELENAVERELRLTGNKISADSLVDNTYLNNEIRLCLTKCPFLNIK